MNFRTRVHWPKLTRDTVLFLAGLLGIIHETLLQTGAERPYLLIIFGGMMGLPVFFRSDEKKGGPPQPPPLPPLPQLPDVSP